MTETWANSEPETHSHFFRLNGLLVLFILVNAARTLIFDIILVWHNMQLENLAFNGIISILLSIVVFFGLLRTKRLFPAVVFYFFQSLFILVNLSYFIYMGSYLHFAQYYTLFGEAMSVAAAGAAPYDHRMLIVLLDTPFFAAFLVFLHRNRFLPGKRRLLYEGRLVLYCLILLIGVLGVGWSGGRGPVHLLHHPVVGEETIVNKYGLFTLVLAEAFAGGPVGELELGRKIHGIGGNTPHSNVIIIQVESLGSAIINLKYQGKPVMPFLHDLSRRSVYYPYMLTYRKAGGSSDSEFAAINSIEPMWKFPAIKLGGYEYPNSFVRRLFDAGYTALAFHGNIGNFFNRKVAYGRMRYSDFLDRKKMGLPIVIWGATDSSVFQYVSQRIKVQPPPFFYHVITMASHEPYSLIPNYYKNPRYDGIEDNILRNYFISMTYVDEVLAEFMHGIQQLENTYIFIYGDHTPYCKNEGNRFKNAIYRKTAIKFKHDYLEFVPLLILTPEGAVRRETNFSASLLDIAPTILNAGGVDYTIHSNGQDLLVNPLKDDYIPFQNSMYTRSLLYKLAEMSGQ